MSPPGWSDAYATGVASIDDEHREILDMIDEVAREIRDGGRRETIVDLLAVIRASIRAHFAEEERIMRGVEFADFGRHKADHDLLLAEIQHIMADYEMGRYEARPEGLSQRLDSWFSVHFKEYDALLEGMLAQMPPAALAS